MTDETDQTEIIRTKNIKTKGMHCGSCEKIIEKAVRNIEGVSSVKSNYENETAKITYDSTKTNINEIMKTIEDKGYKCSLTESNDNNLVKSSIKVEDPNSIKKNKSKSDYYSVDVKTMGWIFGVIGVIVAIYFIIKLAGGIHMPAISEGMGLGLLFVVGLLTGFHCIAMCGGFVVSYTTKQAQEGKKTYKSHIMYATGKTLSYTIIGAIFGLIGSIIAFTPLMRGVAGIIAGLFLLIFGLNMLNIFPFLRKIRIKMPRFINRFVGKKSANKNTSPLVIGLLNGLMIACGPLQAIYVMAAGTGSPIAGAKLLFVFAIGTLPVMLGFGFLTSVISAKATKKILKVSGALVIVLGLIMINRGFVLTGTGGVGTIFGGVTGTGANALTGNTIALENGYQIIEMNVTSAGWQPDTFVLRKGVPVKWKINGLQINGCNNAIEVPKYGLKFDIKPGEQIIEFTPDEAGIVRWSCWMGMIPGKFIITDDTNIENSEQVQREIDAANKAEANSGVNLGGSCGGIGGVSCGSPTCGASTGGGCGCGH